MRVVIDSNRIIAALIKDSTTRKILFDDYFDFIAPEFVKSEIEKYRDEIISKSHLTKDKFDILLSFVFEHIKIVPKIEYKILVKELEKEIFDFKDISYLAVSVAKSAEGIWSHDPHFKEQNKVKVFTNIDMLRTSGKAEDKMFED